ncbi:TetR/AcrR family transcriptional regulator [Methylophilus aquaticus]|uniref:TetR/AcrR family transcriptional regulator n=1 Tax=Methylophilus aquaticus TaxID=1971610 RepID=A0ABT9JS48_9PROT|nr:TetR/AcrR family transcriptional regulator [Methylophilus aquaticus]MDP8567398.1 TetR/AcrR family transcriptional regulator [Methylophilus aquaticus]
MTEIEMRKKRGRPAAFDYDTALDQAMYAFWRYGYEGTSMSTLMEAMQMNKTSIYAAFGSKEALFEKVIARYINGPAAFVIQSLNQPTAEAVVRSLLTTAVRNLTSPQAPNGCLVIQGALSCSPEGKTIQALLAGIRREIEQRLYERFERAKAEHDLPAEADAKVLAKLALTLHQGISVQASTGASEAELTAMLAFALTLFK